MSKGSVDLERPAVGGDTARGVKLTLELFTRVRAPAMQRFRVSDSMKIDIIYSARATECYRPFNLAVSDGRNRIVSIY